MSARGNITWREVECEQSDNCEDTHRNENSRAGGMCVRCRAHRNRFSGALGLARSFRRQSARAWRCLRDLRGQLARSRPGNQRNDEDHELQGCRCGDGAQFLRSMWYPALLRANAFAAHGEYPQGALWNPHRPAASLSHRDRRDAGVGLPRRAVGRVKGIPRCRVGPLKKEKAVAVRWRILRLSWNCGPRRGLRGRCSIALREEPFHPVSRAPSRHPSRARLCSLSRCW